MPTRFRPTHAGKPNAHCLLVPSTPGIPGRPGTTAEAGSEGTPARLGTPPVIWDATSASLSVGGEAAGAREGDGVGAEGVAGVGVGELVCWW